VKIRQKQQSNEERRVEVEVGLRFREVLVRSEGVFSLDFGLLKGGRAL
jgi:hypothetical protein